MLVFIGLGSVLDSIRSSIVHLLIGLGSAVVSI